MDIVTEEPHSISQEEPLNTQLKKQGRMWDGILGGILYLLAIFFHFYRLGDPSLWYDETWSMDIARKPFGLFWHIISTHDPNMGLYYFLLRFWVQILGSIGIPVTEFWARFPSVFFSSLASIFIYLLAKRFFGRFTAAVVTILFIVNIQILAYAQQVRSYGLLIFLLSLSWYFLILLLSSPSVKKYWWIAYILSTALAVYAQLFSVFVIAAQLMTLVGVGFLPSQWRRNLWQRWKMLLLSLTIAAILIIPELWIAMHNVGKVDWLPRPIRSDLYRIFRILTGNNNAYFFLTMALLGLGSLIVIVSIVLDWKPAFLQLFPKKSSIREPLQKIFSQVEYLPIFWCSICWLLVPLLLSYAMSLGANRYFSFRYLMVITPGFCLLVGLGLVLLRNRTVQIILSIPLLILAIFVGKNYYTNAQIEDWRTPTQWVQSRYQVGDGILCYDNIQGCQYATEYYFDTYPQSGAHYTPDTPGYWFWTQDSLAYQDAMQTTYPQALAKFATHHPHIFYIIGRLSGPQTETNAARGQAFLDTHYRFVGQYSSGGVSVRDYVTKP